nr:hypothetical protein [Kibdelosporangium sp. MJ126-NF4]CEL15433.1 hypothetical protein [Kibdelosporangium sp. MJ126-NF4]CEL15654.1 hypothetical protein [Kibdelosporangium sp. MJ126-NF4]CEL22824.1 hypothetical protein [Kibdelosporangium sp. MJ126-NF4]CEL23170.1 hypothetical protein [Kibdelosporangium sp. MJ126-NF4]
MCVREDVIWWLSWLGLTRRMAGCCAFPRICRLGRGSHRVCTGPATVTS